MLNAASQVKSLDGSLTSSKALRSALVIWLGLMAIPFVMFLYVVWQLSQAETAQRGEHNDGQTWFLLSAAYLLMVVPISFFWRSWLFKSYYSGTPVRPDRYLFGMISVWIALVIGGLFSLTGCLIYKSLLPDLIPALVAFMFCVTLWPSGRAMSRSVGSAEDPEVYEEPR